MSLRAELRSGLATSTSRDTCACCTCDWSCDTSSSCTFFRKLISSSNPSTFFSISTRPSAAMSASFLISISLDSASSRFSASSSYRACSPLSASSNRSRSPRSACLSPAASSCASRSSRTSRSYRSRSRDGSLCFWRRRSSSASSTLLRCSSSWTRSMKLANRSFSSCNCAFSWVRTTFKSLLMAAT
ncbi:hypothetical protein GDO86_006697 [Hymenochirus boettgeri]|uniref:Uncharacterized protein n=1 Tax=Hymenochirus boettgeri TaxID=247094 RepID=A0A8T2J9M8_9PIPI|nr:hypothetical protein GDO86_006697 [Hymenochirus boettgeri]